MRNSRFSQRPGDRHENAEQAVMAHTLRAATDIRRLDQYQLDQRHQKSANVLPINLSKGWLAYKTAKVVKTAERRLPARSERNLCHQSLQKSALRRREISPKKKKASFLRLRSRS